MSKRLMWALLLIGFLAVVLVLNKGTVDLHVIAWTLKNLNKSLVLLGFSALGLVIGLLLK